MHFEEDRRFVTALARGLELLKAFKWGERWLSHQELARRSRLPKATVSRLAFTLVHLGYLVQHPATGEYGLGPGGLAMGFRALAHSEIANGARLVMEELAHRSQAAVSLGMRHQAAMVYIAHARGQGRLTLSLDVGARIPIADTSMGRAFVASLDEGRRTHLYGELARHHGPWWPHKHEALERARERYRRHGFVMALGEWESDVSAVGVSLDIGDGREPYALNLGGPRSSLSEQRLRGELGPQLVEAAGRIVGMLRNGG